MSPSPSRTSSPARLGIRPADNGVRSVNGAKRDDGGAGFTITLASPLTIVPNGEVRVRRLIKMVESKPAQTIQQLAADFNLSESHLQHLFKQETGKQLGHFLLEQRLITAAHLLESTNRSVKEIAAEMGYEHASSFIRAFERRFGTAPRRYRLQSDGRKC